jgi:hypothetical protein
MKIWTDDFPLFRYADILLMGAEAKIRQGKNGDNLVNQVRQRAGVSAWTGTTLDMILAERGGKCLLRGTEDKISFVLRNSIMPGGQNRQVLRKGIYFQFLNGPLMPIQI